MCDDKNPRPRSRVFVMDVGVPRIELGSYAPEAHILPLYYTPLENNYSDTLYIVTIFDG